MSANLPPRHYLPGSIQRRGSMLLNQQCWLWGQDVKGAEGNLLLLHGFDRQRPRSDNLAPASTLSRSLARSRSDLGFGMYFGTETGIFINRFEFVPREARINDLWQAQEMTGLPRARGFSLLVQALRWIGGYEHWVLRTFGLEYRKACLRRWEAATHRPDRISDSWNELASLIERSSCLGQKSRDTTGCLSPIVPDAENRITYTPRTNQKGRTRDQSPGSPAAASV